MNTATSGKPSSNGTPSDEYGDTLTLGITDLIVAPDQEAADTLTVLFHPDDPIPTLADIGGSFNVYDFDMLALIRPGVASELGEARQAVQYARSHHAREAKAVALPNWEAGQPLSEYLARMSRGLDTPGAKLAWFMTLPAVDLSEPESLKTHTTFTADASVESGEDLEDAEIVDRWPRMHEAAYYGLAGEIVSMVDPQTEADPVATLIQLLVVFANLIGRGPHFVVGATRHYLNLFAVLVGMTSTGRKGSSWDAVRHVASYIDPDWERNRVKGGLVSGEGLIYHVRDPISQRKEIKEKGKAPRFEDVIDDAGVTDKRVLIVETEFSRTLKAMARESNTLSDVIRQSFDSGSLSTLAKNCPNQATGAHISIVAHCTEADIRRHLTETDAANGFANRFLWPCVRDSKDLPDGGDLFEVDWTWIGERLQAAAAFARTCGRMKRDKQAEGLWREVYGQLKEVQPGLLGSILTRAAPLVMRLACVYALLGLSGEVRPEHLTAALAIWKHNEDSARLIFPSSGDSEAEKLLAALRQAGPDGLTRKQIKVDVFGGHKRSAGIAALLERLLTRGQIRRTTTKTAGRPAEVWHLGRRPGS